jgi:exosortase
MNLPATQAPRSRWFILGLCILATVVLYFDVLRSMVNTWWNEADYSHGFLVPFFAAYILYANRSKLAMLDQKQPATWEFIAAVSLVVIGLGLRLYGFYDKKPSVEGVSLIPFLLGVFMLCLGAQSWRWAWAPVLFLVFMVPLPGEISKQLAGALQTIATLVSTFTLQLLGFTAFAEGNVISLSQGKIGVAEACSGLRMLFSFFALTAGACLMIDRTWIEKVVIAMSAIPIAIIANCIRIIATGIAFEYFDSKTAEHFFHDIAGWLMMPLGFLILLVVLSLMDRILIVEQPEPDF